VEEIEIVDATPQAGAGVSRRRAGYEAALASVVNTLEQVGLPRVEIPLVLFPSRRAFERGLLEIGYSKSLARSASAFNAIGGARAVLLNATTVDRLTHRQRVQLLAHEVVHSVQYQLSGGTRGASEQWLREGFAEWVACRVTAHLGLASIESLRAEILEALAGAPFALPPAPFDRLATFPDWVDAQGRYEAPLYVQAFLAAELLVETHGVPAIVRYFELFKGTQDRDRAFREAFGVEPVAFERLFMRRWRDIVSRTSDRR
jgi:hypothetical protein